MLRSLWKIETIRFANQPSINYSYFAKIFIFFIGFVSFGFISDIYFSCKKIGVNQLKCNFSRKNLVWLQLQKFIVKLCMHTDYDHFYIPVTSKKGKFQPKTNIFPGNNMGKIMGPKCGHLMLLRGISR